MITHTAIFKQRDVHSTSERLDVFDPCRNQILKQWVRLHYCTLQCLTPSQPYSLLVPIYTAFGYNYYYKICANFLRICTATMADSTRT